MNKTIIPCVLACTAIMFVMPAVANAPAQAPSLGKVALSGGMLAAPIKGKTICVVNNQKRIPVEVVREWAKRVSMLTTVPIQVTDKPLENSPVVITLLESDEAPRMLIAPEDGWGSINLTKILEGASDATALVRFKKEFWRVFSYTLGAGNPMMQPALMRVVRDNENLDAHPYLEPNPELLNVILNGAKSWGLERARIVTYRRACQEGWAPMPTNDVQKAIWERVKAEQSVEPTKAIQIKFDPKVGK